MATVLMKRANGECMVPEEKVTEFLAMGYSVIDLEGHVLVEAEPSTLPECKLKIKKLNAEIEALKAENELLKNEQIGLLKEREELLAAQDGQKSQGTARKNAVAPAVSDSEGENKAAQIEEKTAKIEKAADKKK